MRKWLCLSVTLLMALTAAGADGQWIDVTTRFVQNPRFDGESTEGWQMTGNASSKDASQECMRFYNGTCHLWQELKGLPNGKYRLRVQGFYRAGSNDPTYAAWKSGNERVTAFLYAGSQRQKFHSVYDASLSYAVGGDCWSPDGGTTQYPNNRAAAVGFLARDLYWNTLEFEAQGTVAIGVVCDESEADNWCVFDNFTLEYATSGTSDGKDWIDVSSQYLTNPGFSNSTTNGWQWQSDADSQTSRVDCMEFWNGTFDIHQTVKSAPKGKYRLSVQAYYRCKDNEFRWGGGDYQDYKDGTQDITAYMYAGGTEQKLVSVYSESLSSDVGGTYDGRDGKYFPNTMESARQYFDRNLYWNTMEFEADGSFDIGLKCSSGEYSNWCIFDNFRLEYYGEAIKVSGIALKLDHTELVVGETLTCEATVSPADAVMQLLTWSSSNEQVATVDDDGRITATGEGTATITATAIDGSGVSQTATVTVTRNKATAVSLIINEIMVSNVDEYVSPAFNFDGWMELYNPTDKPVELGGLQVSDPTNGEGPWRMPDGMGVVPAKGFRLVWFDSNDICPQNASFKLDVDGGTIVISDESGRELVRQGYPEGMERVSYARSVDGAGEWGYTATPTPGGSNDGSRQAQRQLAAPVVNQPSQLFSGNLSVSVTIPSGSRLRYTTDGTLPTLTNGATSANGLFTVSQTSNYRFRLFADGYLPSRVTTRSFILRDRDYSLPVVSVVTDPDFLYSTEIGVMEKGPNGRPGNGQSVRCNWNMNWERPVNFSYLTADGEMVLNQDVNLEMCGGWSRAWTPHAFKLKGNKELGGDKNLLYPFFAQKPYIRNRTLQIRNGGNDNNGRFKDPSLQYIAQTSGLNLDCQSYQPVHEFINGSYVGVLNVREPNNKHYVYANYGWDDEEIDQFEMSPDSGYVQKCGTADAFNELVDVLAPDAANSETYAEICRQLDIDAYANYMAAEMYLCNWDWPQNNVKGFRYRDGGKFRFVLFDLDGSFNGDTPYDTFFGKERYTFDQLYPTSLGRITDQIRFVSLFRHLLKNDDFRRRFITAVCIMGGSVYETSRVNSIVDQLLSRVEPAMNLEWGSASWSASDVKNNLSNRYSRASNQLRNYSAFNLRSTQAQRVTLKSDTEGAQLIINGQQVPTGAFNGHLFRPATLRAVAPAGYKFKEWQQTGGTAYSTSQEIALPTGTVALTATYTPLSAAELAEAGVTPVRVNEVSGSNDSYIDEYGKKGDWVELYNTTDHDIDVEGMYLTDNLDKPTKYQITKGKTKANTVIRAHEHFIIWCDNKRATTDRGLHATFKIDGDGGLVALMAADRSWTDVLRYGAHDATATVGRYPDGASEVYTMNVPTIGRHNVPTSYMTLVDQTNSTPDAVAVITAANGFRLRYGSAQLLVKSDEAAGQALVEIFTADGQQVECHTVGLTRGTARLSVAHLAPGFYVARATDSQGTRVSCKFMK